MRVIAGEARGVPLAAPPARATRPTSDLVKGALFATLGDAGCTGRILDLFAGSGALGIEALSRGADFCDFVESAGAACRTITANLDKTRLADRGRVRQQSVEQFLASAREPYDLVLLDPPYALDGVDGVVAGIGASTLVHAGSTLVLEHSSRRPPPPRAGRFLLARTRVHGDTAISVYTVSESGQGTTG